MEITYASALRAQGQSPDFLRTRARRGELVRVYPGAYIDASALDASSQPAELRHAAATIAAANSVDGVVSGVSAANLYRLPLLQHRLQRPVLFTRTTQGNRSPWVRIRRAVIDESETTVLYGMRVTTLDRTLRDAAEVLPLHEMLALTDAAMRLGFDPASLPTAGRHSVKYRWLAAHASDRSESFAESWSRFLMLEAGLPAPELQVSIHDEIGRFVGRSDFGWPDVGGLGEFDGRVKYRKLGHANGDPEAAMLAEKHREIKIAELGWEVGRWMWAMHHEPHRLVALISGLLSRAALRPPPRGAWRLDPLPRIGTPEWPLLFGRPRDFPLAS